jgi:thiol:disulfide interchange protein
MKKRILILGLGVLTTLTMISFTAKETKNTFTETDKVGMVFTEGTFAEICAKAKKEKKNIFFDAYASWCGPCKLLKRDVFTTKTAGYFFNKKFINVAMDMEKGEGAALAPVFQITAYPTLLILNHKGEIIGRTMGYQSAEKLIEFAKPYVR